MGLTAKQIKDNAINDVGSWGDKDLTGTYDQPLMIAGEKVDLRHTPAFGFGDETADEMGDLQTDPATAGDVYESEARRAPLRL